MADLPGKKRKTKAEPQLLAPVYEERAGGEKQRKILAPVNEERAGGEKQQSEQREKTIAKLITENLAVNMYSHRGRLLIAVAKNVIAIDSMEHIGSGAFGAVFRYTNRHNDSLIIKVSKKLDEANLQDIPRETKRELCMYGEKHPNIVKVWGIVQLSGPYPYGIIFEDSGIELFDYVQSAFGSHKNAATLQFCRQNLGLPREPDTNVRKDWMVAAIWDRHIDDFAVQLLNGLVHLHSNGVFHNDIKLENILVSVVERNQRRALQLKYGDFGLAHCSRWRMGDHEFVGVYSTSIPRNLEAENPYPFFGSLAYLPDGRIATSKSFSYRRDQYSLGISLFCCAYGGFFYEDHKRGTAEHPSMYDRFLEKLKEIQEDDTDNLFFGQVFNITRRAPIETLLKKLISFQPDFVGEIWKQVSPTSQRSPTCFIEQEEKEGVECLKNDVVWDPRTGPTLTRKEA